MNKFERFLKVKKQSGATLIVVLVILVAMTFLGLGAMSDTNIQLAMVRNSQLQATVYTAALTEINAQIDEVNGNTTSDTDQIILDIVQENIVDGSRSTNPAKLLKDVLGVAEANLPYTASLTLVEPNADVVIPVEGFSISPDSTIKWLVMELQSSATVNHTNTSSDQTQGFRYLSAN